MANDMFLYWGSGSGPCWRVMLVLAEKGLQYKDKMISFGKQEQKCEEIMQINPRGQVPTFKHGDVVISESMAICEYLEHAFKGQGTHLIPEDPKERACVLQKMFEALNIQTNCIKEVFLYLRITKEEDIDQETLKRKKGTCRKEIELWEGYMGKMGDKSYIAGKTFSMADCVFFASFAFLVRLGLDLKSFPHLACYYNLVKDRESVKSTWPPHWKDSEGQTILSDI